MKAGLALGGNLGDTVALLQTASRLLDEHPEIGVLNVSRNYTTSPVGAAAGSRFVNSAILIETSLAAEALLDVCQRIEHEAGRVREIHWGPRTLDIDLIFFGSEILETERLIIPHPACWYRRFVLDPLCDVAAGLRHPVLNQTFAQLRDRLRRRPLTVSLGQLSHARQQQLHPLLAEYDVIEVAGEDLAATLILIDRPLTSRSRQQFGELYEQDLPGSFDAHLKDVLNAALDEPRPYADS
ncbi:2-amino-4-hydroxy-6-hydroxymethyldihydropteridine diphosphokinase [Rubinisphaera margarita]|uniref:2-amino-4-hydroxy-6- hydroxymethyldihydropteridine diphosphokinase n=1 Tax=Rubinisphaera margarita TaxID=2909586 RepID=UPI001EE85EF8|nr:2-amino-4-hydroxy-6-hydroxymethyldihydropteridine diphosphokinase [Rubinisphaera margarita]MCG6155090.1 2-amino-4-hydroxy-6-hydroxymethyldihydropteridine diphosphokinase [Rubinisphaera margarita]